MAVRVGGRDVAPGPATALAEAFPGADRAGGRSSCTACARTSRTGDRQPRRRSARRTPRCWPRRAGPRSSCAPTPGWRCARTAWRWPPCSSDLVERLAGRRSTGSPWSATRWAALVMRAAGAVAAEVRAAVDRPGHRRRHPRHPAPRRPARPRGRPRQPGPGPAARDRRLRPDPRLALGRRPRPRAPASAEDVPPLPHARYHLVVGDPDPLAAPPGRPRARATSWCGCRRRTAATGTAASCSRAPTCCTSAGTGHFDLLNHPRRPHARCAGWLA